MGPIPRGIGFGRVVGIARFGATTAAEVLWLYTVLRRLLLAVTDFLYPTRGQLTYRNLYTKYKLEKPVLEQTHGINIFLRKCGKFLR